MRCATPPEVRKFPARMKNGIAMISKRSMLVNSLRPTIFGSTLLKNEQIGQHRKAERDRDRHAGRHQRQQQREQQLGAHRLRQIDDVEPAAKQMQRQHDRNDDDQRRRDLGGERPRRRRAASWRTIAHRAGSASRRRGTSCGALIVAAVAMMRHDAGAQEAPHHLQKAEAHQIGAERDAQIDHPARPFELLATPGRHRARRHRSRPACR